MTVAVLNPQRVISGTIIVGVVIRLLAAGILVFGPWTDEAAELDNWDIERFTVIATEDGRAWRDHPVEYPPGSVAVFETLVAKSDGLDETIVGAHRRLVVIALAADLLLAWLLTRRNRRRGAAYLALGLPLVPMGLLRLDIVVALLATAAAMTTALPPGSSTKPSSSSMATRAGAALLSAAAILTKVWPGLLIPAYWALRRDRAAIWSIATTAAASLLWLLWAGSGLDPVRQIIELRGATGWHVESSGGVITALADASGLTPIPNDSPVMFQLNAFRIGTLSPLLVTVGRVVTVAVTLALAWRVRLLSRSTSEPNPQETLSRLGAFMLGSTALLLATAPLLSPQFILWLTPWAALLIVAQSADGGAPLPAPVIITAVVAVVTGLTLAVFGPPRMAETAPAVAMAARNGLLAYLPISCWRWLGQTDRRFAG